MASLLVQIKTTIAQNCAYPDDVIEYARAHFVVANWIRRGVCLRAANVDDDCYAGLERALADLTATRAAEHGGAAGVLALLPTIGALLGAPTTEIWRLRTVVPFGGSLAMALSFGGAILPVKIEDYENDLNNNKSTLRSVVSLRARRGKGTEHIQDESRTKIDELVVKIEARMRQEDSQKLPRGHLIFGLCGMGILLSGA